MRLTPFSWPAIRQHLFRTSLTTRFRRDFDVIRRRYAHLSCYHDPSVLLDALHSGRGNPDEKNQVLAALLEVAQTDQPEAECALTLMLLALWPGLDAVLRRSRRRRLGTVEELTSAILAGATEAIRCIDPERVRRMAATVLRNVERDLLRSCRKEAVAARAFTDSDADKLGAEPQIFGCDWLLRELHRLIGADSGLVFQVAVEGFSQTEVAARLGLSEAATRKRYQRATCRLRQSLQFA